MLTVVLPEQPHRIGQVPVPHGQLLYVPVTERVRLVKEGVFAVDAWLPTTGPLFADAYPFKTPLIEEFVIESNPFLRYATIPPVHPVDVMVYVCVKDVIEI